MHRTRYTIIQLLLLTMFAGFFCAVLMNDNEWLRATLVTAALGMGLNALLAAIFARGQRQAFAIGYVAGTVFFGLSINAYAVTLPFLLTVELRKWIEATSPTPPGEEHFVVIMSVFWITLTAIVSGRIGQAWHNRIQTERLAARDGAQ